MTPKPVWDGVERRATERFGIIEHFFTISYQAMRKHMPEAVGEKPGAMAHAA